MKLDKSVQTTLIIVVGVLILGLVIINSVKPSYANTISVAGVATVKAMPDLIGVYFNVDTQGATSNDAADANSEITDTLINSLIAKGFERNDIQTQSYSVYPEYNYQTNTIKGYRATHSLRVEVPADESEKIGDVIDSGIDAGAGVSYVNFELSQENQNTYKAEAMKLAAQDATAKAEGVAEGLGKKLGSLVSVSIDDYNYIPWLARDFSGVPAAEAKEASTSIVPSEQEITARVTAIFRIR
ncbi:MAG: SIMPL domain-containing protein [Candidatus Pacearchaeota archaeon]|nr:SIMPL domain-containing protein [Nanoarchaeota archaeon]MDZ4226827.1 SIMPL domain-containing protein [Candidatus Pacearchaeota archaeon]